MAEAIVSFALEQLASILSQQISGFIGKHVSLVGDIEEDVDKLTHNLQAIQAVLLDADQKQMKNRAVRVWLTRLKDACYDVEDVLDEWNTEIMKLKIEGGYVHNALAPKKKVCCFFPSPCFGFKEVVLRHDIAVRIIEINKKLDAIAKEKGDYNLNVIPASERPNYQRIQTTTFIDVSDICGRDVEKNYLINKLLCESSEQNLQIISLVGMGGIGKTALAQYVYNNGDVKSNFNIRIWVCVSDPFDELMIARAIIQSLENSSTPIVGNLQFLLQRIHDSIAGNKFLLILDDVWNEDYNKWEPFYHCLKNGLHGSKILITTRKESVTRIMKSIDIINIKELSDEENWKLFRRLALFERPTHECEKLEEIGREIVKKCKGLPLATKTIGSLLQSKRSRDEWQRVLYSKMWELEEIEKGLLSPLMLSYNDLPSSIRKCFSYCAIFPKDYNIRKDILINLWMAQGYLGLEKNTKLETIGKEYFHHLATRSFFQEFSSDYGDAMWSCKMHDIVHDFALFLSDGECLAIEVNIGNNDPFINSFNKNVRHLMLKVNKEVPFPMSICSIKSLRSLVIEYVHSLSSDVFPKLCELTCLRALKFTVDFFDQEVMEIPKEMEKLRHLRYLDFNNQFITRLPESLCELYNLHTLDITESMVTELPSGIEKLVNLRRLKNETWSLFYIPKGIEKLTGLQTLSEFVISGGGDYESRACSLEGIKNLNNLEGSLTIRGLGNVTNMSDGKMKEVLKNKKYLTGLSLQFDKGTETPRRGMVSWKIAEERESCEDYEVVLEAIQPPPELEGLSIKYYAGRTFPSTWKTSLTKLKSLCIMSCPNCKNLHPLGKLSSLEELFIGWMENVKKVDNEFWGIESGASSSSGFFPKLKQLQFCTLEEWEEWTYENTKKGEEEEHIRFMPCLATLHISSCYRLKALPDSLLQRTTLKKLRISGCPILKERYKEGTGEDWSKISHIPTIDIW